MKSCDREEYVARMHKGSLHLDWECGYAKRLGSSPRELPDGTSRNAVKTGR